MDDMSDDKYTMEYTFTEKDLAPRHSPMFLEVMEARAEIERVSTPMGGPRLKRIERNRLAEAFIRGLQVGAEQPDLAGDGDAMYAAFRRWADPHGWEEETWPKKGLSDIHLRHWQSCNCLADTSICCVPDCLCKTAQFDGEPRGLQHNDGDARG